MEVCKFWVFWGWFFFCLVVTNLDEYLQMFRSINVQADFTTAVSSGPRKLPGSERNLNTVLYEQNDKEERSCHQIMLFFSKL